MSKIIRGAGVILTAVGAIMIQQALTTHDKVARAEIKLKTIGGDAGTMYGICGKDDEDLDMIAPVDFNDKQSSNLKYNFFNIENPKEYLKGSDAIAVERGPYLLKKHTIKYGVDFKESKLTESADPIADGAIEYNVADLYIPLDKNIDVTSTTITRNENDLSLSWSSSTRKTITSYDKMMQSHLTMNDKITNLSPMYQSLLAEANDEFTLVLSMVCAPKQIENILSANTKAQCLPTELNDMDKVDCSCCMLRDMFVSEGQPAGIQVCDEILDETGDLMAELSLLAYYDNGVVVKEAGEKVFSGGSNFVQTGYQQDKIYSPVIQSHTVNELLFGHPSAYMGQVIPKLYFAQAHKTMKENGVNDSTETAAELLTGGMDGTLPIELGDIASYTKKVGSVCLATCAESNPLVGSPLDFMCDGFAPERHELSVVDDIILGGIDCKPYSATYSTMKMCTAIDSALAVNNIDPSMEKCACADGSDDYKTSGCCLASGKFNGADLTTRGCLYPVEGVLGTNYVGKYTGTSAGKPKVDLGEASEALVSHESGKMTTKKTAQFMCPEKASSSSLFIPEHKFFGRYETFEGSDSHVTFHSTRNRRMRQTDTNQNDTVSYSVDVNAASTKYFPATGYSGYYNHMSLTYGHTFRGNIAIFMKEMKAPIMFKEDWGARPMVCDDDLCHIISRLKPVEDAFVGTNVTNLAGVGMPLDGLQAIGSMQGPNEKGRPTYYHNPFYMNGDIELLTQQNNSHVEGEDGNGVKIYRVLDSASDPGVFAESNSKYQLLVNLTQQLKIEGNQEQNEYQSYIDIEPATGLGVRSRLRYGVSHSVWECDPASNNNCKLARKSDNSGKCYSSVDTYTYPCSASNILTPGVIGGKIMPTFWFEDYKQEVDNTDIGKWTVLAKSVRKSLTSFYILITYGTLLSAMMGFSMIFLVGCFAPKRMYLQHGAVGGSAGVTSTIKSGAAGSTASSTAN